MDHDHDIGPDGAERELDAIHAGGKHLLVVIRQQVSKTLDRLDEGDFEASLDHMTTAAHMIGSLVSAKHHIAIADGARLVRAVDLEPGQELSNIGEITDVAVEPCPSCKHHINVKVGEHELKFSGDQEVYVAIA